MIDQAVFDKIKQKQGQINPLHAQLQSEVIVSADDNLEAAVVRSLQRYFANLQGSQPMELYPMVIGAVEKPLLEFVMKYCGHNKCAAAQLLGINRNTLHKKLRVHKLI